MDSLQGAFIHPQSSEMHTRYFMSSELDPANTRLVPWKDLEGPGQFFI